VVLVLFQFSESKNHRFWFYFRARKSELGRQKPPVTGISETSKKSVNGFRGRTSFTRTIVVRLFDFSLITGGFSSLRKFRIKETLVPIFILFLEIFTLFLGISGFY
jgi:hypothetical protein